MALAQDIVFFAAAMGIGAALVLLHQRLSCASAMDMSSSPAKQAQHSLIPTAEADLLAKLDRAIANDHLHIAYQPKLDARENRICGAEALLRWDALGGLDTNVEQLIQAAESGGRIAAVTNWVIDRVIRDIQTETAASPELKFWVNLSGVLLVDDQFIGQLIDRIGPKNHRIGLEITETAVIEDPERAIANLTSIANCGIDLAIDDYGTGVSSLAYLKQMPVREMKIDRAFVANLTSSNRDPLIIRSTIELAHALEMTVTAEGVDNAISQALLTVMGCDYLQGHHIGKPMPLGDLHALIRDWSALTAPNDRGNSANIPTDPQQKTG
jgi:EAL domain-containing protein (putative c-di-GMP-specific phosphodiesterase class I)